MKRNKSHRKPVRSKRSSRKSSRPNIQRWLFNFVIFCLAVVIIGFMYSFSQKLKHNSGKIAINEESKDYQDIIIKLAEEKEFLDVSVEVLNGCGTSGVAQEFTNYLRQEGFDVINFTNADHFGYTNTMVIQRRESADWKVKEISRSLMIPPENIQRIYDPTRDVDVTVIIGSDYRDIEVYDEIKTMGVE